MKDALRWGLMNELQRYMLFGVALFAPTVALFWLDILRARLDPAFHAAFPRRGRPTALFYLLLAVEALLAGGFPPELSLPLRALVSLAVVAASAAIGGLLFVALKALRRLES